MSTHTSPMHDDDDDDDEPQTVTSRCMLSLSFDLQHPQNSVQLLRLWLELGLRLGDELLRDSHIFQNVLTSYDRSS